MLIILLSFIFKCYKMISSNDKVIIYVVSKTRSFEATGKLITKLCSSIISWVPEEASATLAVRMIHKLWSYRGRMQYPFFYIGVVYGLLSVTLASTERDLEQMYLTFYRRGGTYLSHFRKKKLILKSVRDFFFSVATMWW